MCTSCISILKLAIFSFATTYAQIQFNFPSNIFTHVLLAQLLTPKQVTRTQLSSKDWWIYCAVCVVRFLRCVVKLLCWVNYWSQIGHLYPVCTRSCTLMYEELLNLSSQYWHMYGFTPVWVRLCFDASPDWVNDLSQYWHFYGFCPVCLGACFWQLLQWLNAVNIIALVRFRSSVIAIMFFKGIELHKDLLTDLPFVCAWPPPSAPAAVCCK